MLENKMVLDELWPEYHGKTQDEIDAYNDWWDREYDQAVGK